MYIYIYYMFIYTCLGGPDIKERGVGVLDTLWMG